jgi:hypothetical protein
MRHIFTFGAPSRPCRPRASSPPTPGSTLVLREFALAALRARLSRIPRAPRRNRSSHASTSVSRNRTPSSGKASSSRSPIAPTPPGRRAGLRPKVGLFKLTSRCETDGGRVQRPRCPGVSLPLCGARGLEVVKGNCSSFPGRAHRTTHKPTRSAVATASRADDAYSPGEGVSRGRASGLLTADAGGATGDKASAHPAAFCRAGALRRSLTRPSTLGPARPSARSPT